MSRAARTTTEVTACSKCGHVFLRKPGLGSRWCGGCRRRYQRAWRSDNPVLVKVYADRSATVRLLARLERRRLEREARILAAHQASR